MAVVKKLSATAPLPMIPEAKARVHVIDRFAYQKESSPGVPTRLDWHERVLKIPHVGLVRYYEGYTPSEADTAAWRAMADCKKCHQTLVFSEAKSECVTCHKDVHSMSVGNDCVRCHTSKNWLVNNVQQLHEQNGFQMAGAHTVLSCIDCHKSETNQRWDRIGNDCASCHQKNFNTTTSPNHKLSGFSTNCSDCHEPISTTWGGGNFHYFFSLTQGHDTRDCAKCHEGNNYKTAKPDCISCHTKDYNNATNPKHSGPPFGTNCASCHTTNKGWKPVTVNFHTKFPLTESHNINECAKCHDPNNYGAAKPECASCHMNDYNATTNPKHTQPAFGTNCAECHSTNLKKNYNLKTISKYYY
jgi:hypothetical protein